MHVQEAASSQILDSRRSDVSGRSLLQTGSPPLAFSEVHMGVLLRAEPTGHLYRGIWNAEPVSIKVRPALPLSDGIWDGPGQFTAATWACCCALSRLGIWNACGLAHPNLDRADPVAACPGLHAVQSAARAGDGAAPAASA